jgi:hypothetical protein
MRWCTFIFGISHKTINVHSQRPSSLSRVKSGRALFMLAGTVLSL